MTPGRLTNPVLSDFMRNWLHIPSGGVYLFSNLLQTIITLLLVTATIVFVIMFLIGGIKWILSGSDKGALESAQKTITNALIGLIVTFLVFVIVGLVESIFGLDLLLLNISDLVIGSTGTGGPPGPVPTPPCSTPPCPI